MRNNERLPRDGERVPSNPIIEKDYGNQCCLHQIPFHEYSFFQFSAAQLDRVPVVSDDSSVSTSLAASMDDRDWSAIY